MKKVTTKEFDAAIKEGVVLVDFYAEWCGPCQMLGPELEALESEDQNFILVKVDIDQEPELAQRFKVMSVPSLFLFKDGEEVATAMGFHPKEEMRDFIKQAL